MIDRREFGAGGLAALAAGLIPSGAQAQAGGTPPLTSDIGRLARVLVHSFVEGDHPVDIIGDALLPDAEADYGSVARQHAALNDLLRASGAEVVELRDALAAAMDATRSSGVLAAWVDEAFPRLGARASEVTAEQVLGRDPDQRFRLGPDGAYRHAQNDSSSTIWTRDSAFMTPKGLVICNSASQRRRRENMLLRFVYAHSPMLKDVPIAMDAVEEGMIIEGGDAMVVEKNLLFLGTGNRTDPRIAPVLAQRLDMDVLAVQTVEKEFLQMSWPGGSMPARELRILLLHLDTFFTLMAPRHGLTVPYLLESEFAESSPMVRFIKGARADTRLEADEAEAGLDMLKGFGSLKLFRRGTGAEEKVEGKLVDHLRRLKWKLTWVGGARPADRQEAFAHFMAVAYPELRRQAANVVQATPGRVIAYAGNPATKAAIEAEGFAVDTFPGRDLWAWHGGPHCLTQPLRRS
ncbi:Arginine deiminase [Tsuneonella dongtanensis]|uniref:arginine deiminase n=1 Tax=Tsuneonella dongtanensis TaxID=692370 RepID=A0A1B2AGC4_9SPHN|nr:arginine deiminase family protein [Tsuneonella dongtanensis]ANY21190.1 Arginine deiminase [Tsuneonella dongtanensis]